MRRALCAGLFACLTIAPLVAQAPKGWLLRIDRSTSASDPDAAGSVKLTAAGTTFHVVTPQAATFWNPANTATGVYTLKGTFTLERLSGHPNYYGLVFGGSDLGGPKESYIYFMVAQDGTWLLKRRDGNNDTRDIAGRMPHAAVKRPDASGKCTNALEVRVLADRINYAINGTVVHSTPRTGPTAKTDGLWGFRSNHLLEIQVDGLGVTK